MSYSLSPLFGLCEKYPEQIRFHDQSHNVKLDFPSSSWCVRISHNLLRIAIRGSSQLCQYFQVVCMSNPIFDSYIFSTMQTVVTGAIHHVVLWVAAPQPPTGAPQRKSHRDTKQNVYKTHIHTHSDTNKICCSDIYFERQSSYKII